MPVCVYHPQVEASAYCPDCTYPYCAACMVEFMGQQLCGRCRDLRLAQMQGQGPERPLTVTDHLVPTRNPMALTGYYVGVASLIPCLGLLAGPAAIVLGVKGKRALRENPNLPGQGHAMTAVILGTVTTLMNWGLLLFAIAGTLMQR
jgi:hypothetical protein